MHAAFVADEIRVLCLNQLVVVSGGSSVNVWQLAIGERGQLEVKGEKDYMPLVYRVEIVVEECAASQLYLRLANTTLVT